MDPKKQFYETLATSMIEKFKKRQIDAYYCATKEEAVALATSMLPTQATVGFGGSMTLTESGMMAALQNKTDITLYDRSCHTGRNNCNLSSVSECRLLFYEFQCNHF